MERTEKSIDKNWRYLSMKGSMSTELGIITISPEVIAKYAQSSAACALESWGWRQST